MSIQIGNRRIGLGEEPFVIAEMSGNHNQSLDKALQIVEAAARAGAHALKIQTYTADTMTLNLNTGDFFIDDPDNMWKGRSLYELYQEAYTPWEWHPIIFDRCRELGIIGFSTPFDETAVDFLETLDVPCYKIASFENTDIPLIRKAASTGKPLIISTGMATIAELDETVREARQAGCHDLILLKCTSTYPASPDNSHITTIPHMRQLFQCEVGLSDHTLGIGVPIAAVALGCTVIEKHLVMSREEGGVDAAFSLEPHELRMLVEESERARRSLGEVSYGPLDAEGPSFKHRRTLYFAADLAAGETILPEHIRSIRPGFGLPPKYKDMLIGKKASMNIARGTPVTLDHI